MAETLPAPAVVAIGDDDVQALTTSQDTLTTPASSESTTLTTTNPDGKRVIKKIIKKKKRPARPQVDPATFKTEPPPQTGMRSIYKPCISHLPATERLTWLQRNNLQYLVQQMVWRRSRYLCLFTNRRTVALQYQH